MIGETIKDFKLVQRLGKGGMGEVWAAEQQIIKTKVAIKFLLAEISSDKLHVQRFFNEAIAVSRIKHAGIAKIYDVGFHAERAYLIMEFLEGETLASRIARAGRLPAGQVAEIGRQIASILEATHATGITHRDLKPDNVFLVPDAELASKERVKILDFGIAKLASGNTGATGLTATGGSMGTPAYMAPEQWTDAAKADARADIYSLGCVAFEMTCGRPPFTATSIGEACTQHLTATPPRARSFAPETPPEIDALIARMLGKQPADRPAIAEIATVFARVASSRPLGLEATLGATASSGFVPAHETTLGSAAASRATPVGPPARRGLRGFAIAAASVIVVGGGAIGVYIATRDHGTAAPASVPKTEPPTPVAKSEPPPQPPASKPEANPWIAITPPSSPVVLGIDDDKAPEDHRGFRPSRKILAPTAPYSIQQHEVTWGEIDPWLASTKTTIEYPAWATDATERASLPATSLTWSLALAYCKSIGGVLPSEEQWEYAARGPERRPNAWGSDRLDRELTHAYAGAAGTPVAVETSAQDVTPNGVHDLMGNAQEWTMGLWRDDAPGKDESWVESGQTTVRAVRGLPLAAPPPASVQSDGAAYRERLCATGPCVEKGRKLRQYIGFRCARASTAR